MNKCKNCKNDGDCKPDGVCIDGKCGKRLGEVEFPSSFYSADSKMLGGEEDLRGFELDGLKGQEIPISKIEDSQ